MVILWSLFCHCVLLCARGLIVAREYPALPKQNRSFYFPKYRPEIFFDNKVIPEDVEVDVFLFKDHSQRLFYILEGSHRPLLVTVTPCSSSIDWRLSHRVFPDVEDSWYNHVLRPQQVVPSSPTASYMGSERRSYSTPLAPKGLYTLELKTITSDSTAKVFLSARSTDHSPHYPPLPVDPKVEIVKVRRNRVLISWKVSASRRNLEYCVSANSRNNYHSMCGMNTDLYGDVPSIPPSSTGFGFQWEKSKRKSIVSQVTDLMKNMEPRDDVMFSCVGRKTWHMFKGLHRGKKYYFDVFLIDRDTNASTAYDGANTALRNIIPTSRLRDDSLVTLSLDSRNGFATSSKYHVGKSSGPILLFVQSCTGPGPVTLTVSKSGSSIEILSEEIMDMKTLEVNNVETGAIYSLTLKSNTKNARNVRMWISGKKHLFPFPVLPHDKNVKVFDTLITCESITIGWRTSPDEKVKYCIFRTTAHDDVMRRTMAEPQDFCHVPPSSGVDRKQVLCRRYHRFSKRRFNNVIMQRVKNLDPGTTYLFEVQVTKVNGKMLPYEQVWVTTKRSCSSANVKR